MKEVAKKSIRYWCNWGIIGGLISQKGNYLGDGYALEFNASKAMVEEAVKVILVVVLPLMEYPIQDFKYW